LGFRINSLLSILSQRSSWKGSVGSSCFKDSHSKARRGVCLSSRDSSLQFRNRLQNQQCSLAVNTLRPFSANSYTYVENTSQQILSHHSYPRWFLFRGFNKTLRKIFVPLKLCLDDE
jgi:hypothetical protein